MKRLWNFQEGVLLSSFFFQFADQAVSLRKLDTFAIASDYPVRQPSGCGALLRDFDRIQHFLHRQRPSEGPTIELIAETMEFRSVSIPSDEALCVSNVMSLDIDAVLNTDSDHRMRTVGELIALSEEGLSPGVTFLPGLNIEKPGFRWALRSLLTADPIYRNTTITVRGWWRYKGRGQFDARGLRVQFSGY